ncbi:MAG: hypothetical protein QME61_01985 [Patescibacteria group bacterium]|nr:hypothetical protein [Patescibacteria group bacterium]
MSSRKRDIVRYLHYPENLIKQLVETQENIDFIGRKYINNCSKPLHYLYQSKKKKQFKEEIYFIRFAKINSEIEKISF